MPSEKTHIYYIPVHEDEAEYLLVELRFDLSIRGAQWSVYRESMTDDVSILIEVYRPLSLPERRKIVSCGLEIIFGGVA